MRVLNQMVSFFLISFISFINNTYSQSIPDSILKKIDSICQKFNQNNSPGCVVGIVKNDSLIFSKAYGLANLEYNIPNTPSTLFNVASISKQFTAFSIILLARQGKLQLDDDVHKYLTWFPAYNQKITIRHFLNHTSGIKSPEELISISGMRFNGDVISQDNMLNVLNKPLELNFPAGDSWNYSNGGYILLAEIVKVISGQTLRQFTDSAIFKPLGMNNTHFHDDCTEIDKDRASGYVRKDNGLFSNVIFNVCEVGDAGLVTNVIDMGKWLRNFYENKVGIATDVELLTTKAKLNNGKELFYAAGIFTDTYKGWKRYWHDGSNPGYSSTVMTLPDLKMAFIVFTNIEGVNSFRGANAIADLFVKDTVSIMTQHRDSTLTHLEDTSALQKFVGTYLDEYANIYRFYIQDRKLHYQYKNNKAVLLMPNGRNVFSTDEREATSFAFYVSGKDTLADCLVPDDWRHLVKFEQDTANYHDKVLQTYTGKYYCAELDCTYDIILKDHQLFLTSKRYKGEKLSFLNRDNLLNDFWWMNHLTMLRDAKNNVEGFEVNTDRVWHLKFNKVK